MGDPKLRRRVMKSRNAYKNKNAGRTNEETKAKCRTVIMGCCDPDLRALSRSAPTALSISFYIMMSLFVSMLEPSFEKCVLVEGTVRALVLPRWRMFVRDMTAAFLQGPRSATFLSSWRLQGTGLCNSQAAGWRSSTK